MTISRQIEARIEQLQPAFVFSIADLGLPGEWWECIRVKLGRMIKKGVIEKISRGKYYKPQKTVFGNIVRIPGEARSPFPVISVHSVDGLMARS